MSSVLQVDSLPTEPLGKPTLFLSPLVISLLLCLSLHLSLCFSYFLFPLLFRTLAPHLKVCEVSQLLLTLCDLMDCSLPGFSIHGIFQARILELGCHFLLQGIFPTQGWNPEPLMSPGLAGRFFTTSAPWEAHCASFTSSFIPPVLRQILQQLYQEPKCESVSHSVVSDSL